jgi:hypothetical protein
MSQGTPDEEESPVEEQADNIITTANASSVARKDLRDSNTLIFFTP